MIALLALASATTLAAPPVLDESTMILLRQRLERANALISRDADGQLVCRPSATTDERRLDGMLCDTGLRCAARVKAARGKASQGKASRGAINACVDKRKPEMLAAMRRLREYSR